MEPVIFETTRLRRGNFFFPAKVEVTEQEVIRIKKYGFLKIKRRISIQSIGSIHIRNSQFSSEILFKHKDGGRALIIAGLFKPDAHRLRQLVERLMGV